MCCALAIQLLRAHVSQRAPRALFAREQSERFSKSAGNPQVRDFEIATLIYHQVGRLQIAMDHAGVNVCVIERIAKLTDPHRQLASVSPSTYSIEMQPYRSSCTKS